MLESTLGQILLNDALPEEMRDYGRVLDKKGLSSLLRDVAEKYPSRYREVSHRLATIGHRVAQDTGGYSFGLEHLSTAKSALKIREELQQQISQIVDDDAIDDATREKKIIAAVEGMMGRQQDEVYQESLAEKNPLAFQVLSGSRGNKMNLSTLRGSDMMYVDHRGNKIPVPVLHSYSEGLTPAEYWAGTYGARKGVVDTKLATAKSGFVGKQYNQATHRLVVEDQDDAEPPFATTRGLPVDTLDPDNEGALLAAPFAGHPRDTVLTPKILKGLASAGHDKILVRSPLVGGAPGGGVYAKDAGMREYGRLPVRGEYVGMTAAQALSEPLSQGMLSSKHSGGVSGAAKTVGGFDHINSLIQIPKTLKGGATHANVDGTVTAINEAPGGGQLVTVGGEDHYVPPDTDMLVNRGDTVEAGDVLTEGIPHPGVVVQHKGIGEGRRYFTQAFHSAMKGSGITSHRRNVELLGRGLINHVRLTKETDRHVPGDVVQYHDLERNWTPRPGSYDADVDTAAGRYLEKPVLHYTIGTKVRPSVQADLKKFGVQNVHVHDEPAPFEPEMVRAMDNLSHDPDWMTNMYGSGLKGSLLSSVHHGDVSDSEGTSFVPSLARGVDFGRQGATKAPKPISQIVPVAPQIKAADGIFGGLDKDFATLTRGRDSSWKPTTPATPHVPSPTAPQTPQTPAAPVQQPQQPQQASPLTVQAPHPKTESPTAPPPAPAPPDRDPYSTQISAVHNWNSTPDAISNIYGKTFQMFPSQVPQTQTHIPFLSKPYNLAASVWNNTTPQQKGQIAGVATSMFTSPAAMTQRFAAPVLLSAAGSRPGVWAMERLAPALAGSSNMLASSGWRAAGGLSRGLAAATVLDSAGDAYNMARHGITGPDGTVTRAMQTGLGTGDDTNNLAPGVHLHTADGTMIPESTRPIGGAEDLMDGARNYTFSPLTGGMAATADVASLVHNNAFNNGTHSLDGRPYEALQAENTALNNKLAPGHGWSVSRDYSGRLNLQEDQTGKQVPFGSNPENFLSRFPATVDEGQKNIDPAKVMPTLDSLYQSKPDLVRALIRAGMRTKNPWFTQQPELTQRYGVDISQAAE